MLSDQMREFENQLEWVRSEKDEQIAKLSAEKRNLQVRLNDAESQLSMVKAQKREELKVEVLVTLSNICVPKFVYADKNKPFTPVVLLPSTGYDINSQNKCFSVTCFMS